MFSGLVVGKCFARYGSLGAVVAALRRRAPPPAAVLTNSPVAMGIAVFCNEGIVALAPSARRDMADPGAFRGVVRWTLLAFAAAYMAVGCAGAALYGDVSDELALSFAKSSLDSAAAMVYAIQLVPTSVIVFFLAFETAEGWYARRRDPPATRADLDRKAVLAARVATVLACAVAGAAVPRFGDFIALAGSVTNATCIYVLPHLMYFRTVPRAPAADRAVSLATVAFGVASGVVGTVQSARALLA